MREFARLERELDRLAGLRWRRSFGPWHGRGGWDGGPWAPTCELSERDGDLVVRLELPGIDVERDASVSSAAAPISSRRLTPTAPRPH